jgi:penicillin-binding protein A
LPGGLMGRRIRWLGVIMVACLGLVVAQLVNIQLVKAKQLQTSKFNPRVSSQQYINPRGTITAADGTVLGQSVPTPAGTDTKAYLYHYVRQYPQGPLYAGITGYDSALFYGTAGIEQQYDAYLSPHQQPPQTLSQLLFRQQQPLTTDNVALSVEPQLQNAAWQALTTLPPGANKDGAVVVIQPSTGNILAMVSNPTFDPNGLTGTSLAAEKLAYLSYNQKDHENFQPLQPIATGYRFPPGSTMKVVTSTAAYNLKPALAGFDYPVQQCQTFADAPGYQLCDQSGACGGMMTQMLPFSCDPGYAELGVQLGVPVMTQQSELFGYNSVPGIDLPNVEKSVFPDLPDKSQSHLGQSAIGQFDVSATALQNAMVAAGIANGGVLMTPHLMTSIHDSQGSSVQTYTPKAAATVATAQAAQQVTSLMEGVVATGTADHVGFPAYLCAAVKTGTAQTDPTTGLTDTWMIGLAPANHPQVAVAVVVPQQANSLDGAHVAGPIMNAVLQAAVPQSSVSQPCNVQPVPTSSFASAP